MDHLDTLRAAAERQWGELVAKLPAVVGAMVVLVAGIIVAGLVRRVVQRVLARTSTEGHVDLVVARLAYWLVVVVAAVAALGVLGVSPGALAAGLGVAGVALGFLLKDVLGSFLAGILILLMRPFTIGDEVRIDATEGTVEDIRIRDTVLRAADGTTVFVPNDKVYSAVIANLSEPRHRRGDVTVAVEYGADLGAALEAARRALEGVEGALPDPGPEVLVTGLADGAARLACRFWVDGSSHALAGVESQAATALKTAMDEAGIRLK